MNKRGLSAVVATLIIVLLVLVATGIVWVVIRNIVSQGAEEISLDKISYDVDIEAAYLSGTDAVVSVKRNAGGGEVTGIKFIFYNDQTSTSVERDVVLEQLDRKIFIFNSSEFPANTDNLEVSISLIYVSNGEEKVTDVSDTRKVASGTASAVLLSSSSGNNLDSDDLIATLQNPGSYVTAIYDWKLDGSNIAFLHMPFDTNVDTTAPGAVKDYTDFNSAGTLGDGNAAKAPAWVSNGISGGAYQFDGVDDTIKVPNTNSYAYAFQFWINFPEKINASSLCKAILQYGNNPSQDIIATGSCTSYCTDETLAIYAQPSGYARTCIKTNIDPGWNLLTFSWDGVKYRIYLNGVEQIVYPSTSAGHTGLAYVNNLSFGRGGLKGILDEVQLYGSSISSEQILEMYNGGTPKENVLVSAETSPGNSWSVRATLNDGSSDKQVLSSDSLVIV